MLETRTFDYVFKDTYVSHIGFACACNPYYGMICDIIGAKDPVKRTDPPYREWMPLV